MQGMPRLFSYTVRHDDGLGPNPFRGICTLATCKPKIRLKAALGDWVVGLGAVNAPSGDLSGRVVYAMRVEQILTLREYDSLAPMLWPSRIPNDSSPIRTDRLGDCVYDFSGNVPTQRRSLRCVGDMQTDLGGQNALVSRHYFYFGHNAIPLPAHLCGIIHQTQSHKLHNNAPYVDAFTLWIHSLGLEPGHLYGWPDSELSRKNNRLFRAARCISHETGVPK